MKRTTTNRLRRLLDDWLPAVVRETPVFAALGKVWLGKNFHPHFKEHGFAMTDREFVDTYRAVSGGVYSRRDSDTTPAQVEWIRSRIGRPPLRIVEIGPGSGLLSQGLAEAGHSVFALNLIPGGLSTGVGAIGVAESLPFAERSVDVVVMAHVIEHVRSLTRTFVELARICRGSVLLVTPQQRSFRYTFDYHLHFFQGLGHLASHVPRGSTAGEVVDRDLCLEWKVDP